jgi:hypothetical protein
MRVRVSTIRIHPYKKDRAGHGHGPRLWRWMIRFDSTLFHRPNTLWLEIFHDAKATTWAKVLVIPLSFYFLGLAQLSSAFSAPAGPRRHYCVWQAQTNLDDVAGRSRSHGLRVLLSLRASNEITSDSDQNITFSKDENENGPHSLL